MIRQLNRYIKNIWLDYYEVFKDIRKGVRARPLKATTYGLTSLFILNMFRTNEDLRSYRADITSACNRIGSVVDKSRNPISDKFVQNIGELNCNGLLREMDLGFSTLIYRDDKSCDLALYRYNCPYIKLRLRDRFVDLGILGHWLVLEHKMTDYDINESELDRTLNQSPSDQ